MGSVHPNDTLPSASGSQQTLFLVASVDSDHTERTVADEPSDDPRRVAPTLRSSRDGHGRLQAQARLEIGSARSCLLAIKVLRTVKRGPT